jgi:CHASE3 domain sensor protein
VPDRRQAVIRINEEEKMSETKPVRTAAQREALRNYLILCVGATIVAAAVVVAAFVFIE